MKAYKDIKIDDIIDWCKANNEVAWLKAKADEMVECKVYPKKRVPAFNEDGTPKLKKNGKQAVTSEADKTQPYKIEKRPISFVQIKQAWAEKFMPEIIPTAKPKEPDMWEKIKNL